MPQSDSIRGRVDQTVLFLYEQYDDSYANGLVLFLQVLTDRTSLKDACHRKLTELVQELDFKKRLRVKSKPPSKELSIAIEVGDITTFKADVIALKFAQRLFGADRAVSRALDKDVSDIIELLPTQGYYKILPSLGRIGAQYALFISVPTLYEFEYGEIRQFADNVLEGLAVSAPQTRSLAMTIHGVGYGLDESEALRSQVAGYFDALEQTSFQVN